MMQVFLGDEVTMRKKLEDESTAWLTGQVSGIALTRFKTLERVWIHGFDTPFWMSDGWMFVEEDEIEIETDED